MSSVCALSMSPCHSCRPRASLSSWHSSLSVVRLGGSVRVHAGVLRWVDAASWMRVRSWLILVGKVMRGRPTNRAADIACVKYATIVRFAGMSSVMRKVWPSMRHLARNISSLTGVVRGGWCARAHMHLDGGKTEVKVMTNKGNFAQKINNKTNKKLLVVHFPYMTIS